jgi:hypothetical protein
MSAIFWYTVNYCRHSEADIASNSDDSAIMAKLAALVCRVEEKHVFAKCVENRNVIMTCM